MNRESCPFDQEVLSRYVCCECDSEERMRVERHVRTCRECRRELYELEAVWSVLEEWDVDEVEAPFEPEKLRSNLTERFGEPKKAGSWREAFAKLWHWGILRPVPVAVMVASFATFLAWWDTFTVPPGTGTPSENVVLADATPTPEPEPIRTVEPAEKAPRTVAATSFDVVTQNTRHLQQSQDIVGVHLEGTDEDILSALNRPSVPLPFTPPRAQVSLVADHDRL